MDFLTLCQNRHSIRDYTDQPVSREDLQKILEAGRIAPTAANRQPQKIYVLEGEKAVTAARGTSFQHLFNAPVILLVCYDDTVSWKATALGEDYDGGEVDAAIVTTAMMMEATQLGLGTLWVRGFNAKEVSTALDLPENIHPVCYLLVGHSAQGEPARHTERKPLEETVIWL